MKFFGKFVGAFLLMAATGLLSVTAMAVEAEAEAAFTPCTLDHVHCEADCTLDHQHCVHTGCNLDHSHCLEADCTLDHQHCAHTGCNRNHSHCLDVNCTVDHQHCLHSPCNTAGQENVYSGCHTSGHRVSHCGRRNYSSSTYTYEGRSYGHHYSRYHH